MRRHAVCGAMAAVFLVGAAPAWPATVESVRSSHAPFASPYELRYTAGPGENNVVSLSLAGARVETGQGYALGTEGAIVREEGPGVELTTRTCVPLDGPVLCSSLMYEHPTTGAPGVSAAGWRSVSVLAGDGDDTITTEGMRPGAADTSYGVNLSGGSGDDSIHAQNGIAELVWCGDGTDVAYVDAGLDTTTLDCESVVSG